jgi:16S rRNA (guanine1516-N2)-methyltransferase
MTLNPPDHDRLDAGADVATGGLARGELAARATVAVIAAGADEPLQRQAAQLAAQLGLPLVRADEPAYEMLLTVTAERLELRFPRRGGPGPLYVDFVDGPLGYTRRVNRFGLLFKAVSYRSGQLTVLDANAGLCRDAFRLAYHGCNVTAIERSPILFRLLEDGLNRATRVPEIHEHLGDRLRLVHADARDFLRQLAPEDAPDVVYLDPMFPPRKKSALVKVEMRILRRLIGDDLDASELFEQACAVARLRVVVKRHRLAEPLAPNPSHSHSDKTSRYDVYTRPFRRNDR